MRYLLFILLLVSAFFGGVAWKNADKNNSLRSEVSPVSAAFANATGVSTTAASNPALGSEELATIQLFERAAPSVCFITTSTVQRNSWTSDLAEIPRGSGSGFVWDRNGNVVTNFHVIQGADRATVTLSDQTTWEAEVVGAYPEKDLAVLRIKAPTTKLTPIPVGQSDNLRVGQSVFAIGNPFGLDQTLTTGIVSAVGREIESVAGVPIRDVIQSDAAINPGNSGGPLLDSSGKLIGVNTAIYSPSGASAGIGFSIPVDAVRWVVPELIRYGKVQRPSIGIGVAPQQVVDRLEVKGTLVLSVQEGSAAARAGIRPTYRNRAGEIVMGDIIVGINNETIEQSNDIFLILEKYKPGDVVNVRILRDGKTSSLQVKLDQPR